MRWDREHKPNPENYAVYQQVREKWQAIYQDQQGLVDDGLTTSLCHQACNRIMNMQKTKEKNHEYCFGDNGPKYLIRRPGYDMGVVILQPRQSLPNHRHNIACEVFYTLSGEVCLYPEGAPHLLQAGDVLQYGPGEGVLLH